MRRKRLHDSASSGKVVAWLRCSGLLLRASMAGLALAAAESAAAGDEALTATCAACHGTGGVPISPDIPIIAGQPFTVIDDALILFAEGKRPCTVMCGLAEALGPTGREKLAEDFERRTFVPADQPFDPSLAAAGAKLHQENGCENCHSSGGRNGHGVAPILAGQQTRYLRQALHQIRAKERSGPKIMNRAVRSLGEHEIEALLNFYARNGHEN